MESTVAEYGGGGVYGGRRSQRGRRVYSGGYVGGYVGGYGRGSRELNRR